jgi:hypothetical protein
MLVHLSVEIDFDYFGLRVSFALVQDASQGHQAADAVADAAAVSGGI